MNSQHRLKDMLATLTESQRRALDNATKDLAGRGYPKEHALAMGLAHAHDEGDSVDEGGIHVLSTRDGWAICAEDAGEPAAVFGNYESALRRACEMGREEETLVFAHGLEGTVHDRYDYRFSRSEDGAMHVQPEGGSWVVQTHGEHNDVEAFSTKREAVAHAKPKAKQLGLTLITHYQDGEVQSRIEAH
ncbi:MAG: DUF2188 domain-containing protein [Myxococcales bacterium]|nr:DUF2188 domain-containing protein [Myxococcales bacterium]MCB9540458.1 DUF2188 domain-containing protein [Myxococcales bacterium]